MNDSAGLEPGGTLISYLITSASSPACKALQGSEPQRLHCAVWWVDAEALSSNCPPDCCRRVVVARGVGDMVAMLGMGMSGGGGVFVK